MDTAEVQKHLERIAEELEFDGDEWNEPATDDEIAEAEETLGVTFPETYKKILRLHNGSEYREFMSLEEAIEVAEELEELAEEDSDGLNETVNLSEDKPGVLKNGAYRRGWVPLFDFGTGAFDCVDCDPGPNGAAGQIVRYDPGGVEGIEFDSLEEWLEEFDGS